MPQKQERYRNKKVEQGFRRVELLVPAVATDHLKAYARALRDAHTLGLELPLFEGMVAVPRRDPPQRPSPLRETVVSKPDAPYRKPQAKKKPDFSGGLLSTDGSEA